MGSFSWTKSDIHNTKVANIIYSKPFKFLIPKEFGGGYMKDYYRDYGDLGNSYDMYEILAFWNIDTCKKLNIELQYDTFSYMPVKSKYTNYNRDIGIQIGCYPDQIDKLKYPLKLVSASYKGNYEDCEGCSYGDPNQGWYALSWDEYDAYIKRCKEFHH